MSILFSTAFESDTVGALPSGWTNAVGTWTVSTSGFPSEGTKCLAPTTAADGQRVRRSGTAAQGDTKWQTDFVNRGDGQGLCPMARLSSDDQGGYLLNVLPGSSPSGYSAAVFRMDGGSFTQLASSSLVTTTAVGDIVHTEILCNGSTIEGRVWINATSRPSSATVSTTDSTYATGQVGVRMGQGTNRGAQGFDNVKLQDLSGGSNPGVNGQTLAGINTTAFRQHLKDNALTPNLRTSYSGSFIYPYITPASFYGQNQFVHDACYWCICAVASGDSSLIASGKNALLNFGQVQHSDGFLTQAMASTGETTPYISNPPVIPAAALILHGAAPDLTWLGNIYPIAKGMHTWLAANRTDPVTHLAAWGTKNHDGGLVLGDGTPGPVVQASLEGQDDIGYIYKEFEYSRLVPVAADAQARVNLNMPDLSAYLAGSARDLSTIAGLIGNTTDQATYATEYTNWKMRINKWLWDATGGTYGRYAMHLDSTEWYNPGATVGAAVSVGATSMQITVPSGKAMAITPGMSLICGSTSADGDALIVQRATASASATNSTMTVSIVAATQAVSSGVAVRTASFSVLQTHPTQVMPLWAGVPSPTQAAAVRSELTQVLDGSLADGVRMDFTPWIANPGSTGSTGSSSASDSTTARYTLEKFQSITTRGVGPGLTDWIAEWTSDSNQPIFVDTTSFNGMQLSGTRFVALQRRWGNSPLGRVTETVYDTTTESVSATYPLVVTVEHVAGTVRPVITIRALDGNPGSVVLTGTAFGSTGSGAIVQSVYTYSPTTPVVISQVQIGVETTGGAALNIKSITLTEKPRGFSYQSPYGPVMQPRLSRHSYAVSYDDTRDYTTAAPGASGIFGNHNPNFPDYWKGEIAPYFTWHQVVGLRAYGFSADAMDTALRYCAAASNEYQAFLADSSVGACREWLGMRGAAKGATQYGWAALPLSLMSLFNVTHISKIPLGILVQ